ncbi:MULTISPECIES: 16S rRNA (uracil(1498)-N(3))-methyltransferase [unclassified Leifsonia]|uniref:16S rRNA (uracil(1498)-N(3))-methyltransferase n=1 Tax=unclassified Leifsonia TaxID=2663824 RepID=UPI0006F76134|nr:MULTISPECIES: 16S rRNA (uracil(1498)-N(3))-methyltransferase [unclassified Leifsonia]KQX07095.1 16S rRNA methyltransferase [Leifsonia sp. Root1293]KRA11378.1 16S rRNA methyltransferase [Leifsonia sp. Root60]
MSSLYLRDDLEPDAVGDSVSITGAEARHAVTVGRTRVGETLSIGNGRGLIVTGEVVAAAPSELSISADRVQLVDAASPRLVLVQALAKGDRDELAVQAATELGVDAVIPWAASRSISRWDAAKAAKGRERWATIAREATKQSIRPWATEVRELATTKQLAALAPSVRMLLLEPTAELALTELVLAQDSGGRHPADADIVIVVGPEGGIAPSELDVLSAAGAQAVRLGASVLRTSTAGPAALAVLNARLGRW